MVVWFTPRRICRRRVGACGPRQKELVPGGARHQPRLDDLRRHAREPEAGVSDRRRKGVENARDHAHDRSEPEQEQDGEAGRRRRGTVCSRSRVGGDDSLRAPRHERERPEREPDPDRRRHGDRDEGQRVHRLAPVADDHHVEDREEGEGRETPARGRPGDEGRQGQGGPTRAASFRSSRTAVIGTPSAAERTRQAGPARSTHQLMNTLSQRVIGATHSAGGTR